MKTAAVNKFSNMLKGKCPHCGKSDIFKKSDRLFFNIPKMKEKCDSCGHGFLREPGYFLGAMYISYGLVVFEGIITFLLCNLFLKEIPTGAVVGLIILVAFIFSMKNFKLSRIIYLYIFTE